MAGPFDLTPEQSALMQLEALQRLESELSATNSLLLLLIDATIVANLPSSPHFEEAEKRLEDGLKGWWNDAVD